MTPKCSQIKSKGTLFFLKTDTFLTPDRDSCESRSVSKTTLFLRLASRACLQHSYSSDPLGSNHRLVDMFLDDFIFNLQISTFNHNDPGALTAGIRSSSIDSFMIPSPSFLIVSLLNFSAFF